MLMFVFVTMCILDGEGDNVMIELATQAPGQASLDHLSKAGYEEEQEEESVYMFRYPRGSLKVTRLGNHPERSLTFLTLAL